MRQQAVRKYEWPGARRWRLRCWARDIARCAAAVLLFIALGLLGGCLAAAYWHWRG